jgi:xylulokinase
MPTKEGTYILAIDLGTSGPKVAIATVQGEILGYEFEKNDLMLPPGGGAEQDPEDWWRAIVKATGRLLSKNLVPVENIEAICCTSQWSGTVAVDENGKHLTNAVIWLDTRGAKYISGITNGLIKINGHGLKRGLEWVRITGGIPGLSGKDPIAHILFIKHMLPDIYRRTYKFLEPKDYLNLLLTGKFSAGHDSICLHWVTDNRDLSNIHYNKRLLQYSTIDRDKLPDLVRPIDILGTLTKDAARDLGLRDTVKVIAGTPDVQSAALGSGAVRDNEAHVYVGTSSWMICHVPYKKTDMFHHIASIPCGMPDRYMVTAEQENAGSCLTFFCNNLLYHKDALNTYSAPNDIYAKFDSIAERIPAGSGGVIFTPWLYGERTPVENDCIRSGFHNLSLETNREHLIRSIFEGVAFNSRWLLGYVEKFIDQRLTHINIIGGGAKSDIWCQIYADILNRQIRQVKDPIVSNLRGAAFLASVAMGYMRFSDIPETIKIAKTYEPNPEHKKLYDNLFTEFVNIYKRTNKVYRRLNCHFD